MTRNLLWRVEFALTVLSGVYMVKRVCYAPQRDIMLDRLTSPIL